MTTQSPRAIATIEAAIASVLAMLTNVEAFMQSLRNEPAKRVYVVGFPQYGMYLLPDSKGAGLGSVLSARLLDRPAAIAMARRVRNGKGEAAVAIDYERAISMVLTDQQDLHSFLCKGYADLLQELVDTRAYEADMAAMEAEHLEREADKAAHDHAWVKSLPAHPYNYTKHPEVADFDDCGMHAERARHP